MAEVEYRDVPGWPGYRVGSDGSLWSSRGSRGKVWRLMKTWDRGDDYPSASMFDGRNNCRRIRVHVLVALAFLGPCPEGMEVCHGPAGKGCNAITNIRYGTPSENQRDRVRDGTDNRGERHGASKMTADGVRQVFELRRQGWSQSQIGRKFGVTRENVRAILRGETWSHLGLYQPPTRETPDVHENPQASSAA